MTIGQVLKECLVVLTRSVGVNGLGNAVDQTVHTLRVFGRECTIVRRGLNHPVQQCKAHLRAANYPTNLPVETGAVQRL